MLDRLLAELATTQHGVVAHRQLRDLGFSDSAIARMIARGRLIPLHRGVYAVGHAALHRLARWKAATLAAGDGAHLSHRPAGALLQLVAVPGGRIDVTVDGARGRGHDALRAHSRRLASTETTVVEGIPCTSPARTLLDLACVVRPPVLLEACEQSVRLSLFDLAAVAGLLDRCRGHRGTRRLNAAIAQLSDDPDMLRSELERRLRELVAASSLSSARYNRHAGGASGRLYEVDVHWAQARLIVEADGRAYHATRAAQLRDARKQADLEAAGWRVVRVTWSDVVSRPNATVERLAAALCS